MTDRALVEARLQELYAARVRGDLDGVCACFTDDATLRFSGAGGANPISISAKGKVELRHLLAIMVKSFKLGEFEVLRQLVDGTGAAVHWRARIHSRITGVTVPTELMDLVQVRDGRICAYTEFFAPV